MRQESRLARTLDDLEGSLRRRAPESFRLSGDYGRRRTRAADKRRTLAARGLGGPARTLGINTVTATATDNAGNPTTRSTTFTVVDTVAGVQGLIIQCTDPNNSTPRRWDHS